MKEDNHSDNILSKSVVRITFFIILIICSALILVFFLYEWPSSIEGRFSLTKGCKPYSIIAPCRGDIAYLAENYDTVEMNQPVAYIAGKGEYDEIVSLKHQLDESDSEFGIHIQQENFFGDLSLYIQNYMDAIENYTIESESNLSNLQLFSNEEQVKSLREKYFYIKETISKTKIEMEILAKQANLDSALLSIGAITMFEADKSNLLFIQKQTELLQLESELTLVNKSIISLLNDNKIIETSKTEDIAKRINSVRRAYRELKQAVMEWCSKYELKSPINGILENSLRINEKQTIDGGTEIFKVLPMDDTIEGEVYFNAAKSYGITNGMKVKLILDDYDENEYGYLVGHIEDISTSIISTNDMSGYTCIVIVDLANQSYFKAPLDFKYGMGGKIRFNIHQKSLLEKFKLWIMGHRVSL